MNVVAGVDVSRETFEKLEAFAHLVKKWNPKINLISKSSVQDLWDRHICDSAQLFHLAPSFGKWVDLGSGGGFPGIVIAILGQGVSANGDVTLVESDQRKCAFLRTAIREIDLSADVIADRIENIPPLAADVISARALADIKTLLIHTKRHLKPGGTAIFPKGETWRKEHKEAQHIWSYSCEAITSATNPAAAILKIKDISRV